MTIKLQQCRDCRQEQTSCDRCQTDGVCRCCPCECEYVDPSPEARAAMARYDRQQERRDILNGKWTDVAALNDALAEAEAEEPK